MAHDSSAARLEAEMLREGMSKRRLARLLARDPDDVRQVNTELTNVKRWLKPDAGMSDESAERLARVFDRPADYFKVPRQPRRDRVAELERRLLELGGAVDAILEMQESILQRLGSLEAGAGRARKRA